MTNWMKTTVQLAALCHAGYYKVLLDTLADLQQFDFLAPFYTYAQQNQRNAVQTQAMESTICSALNPNRCHPAPCVPFWNHNN